MVLLHTAGNLLKYRISVYLYFCILKHRIKNQTAPEHPSSCVRENFLPQAQAEKIFTKLPKVQRKAEKEASVHRKELEEVSRRSPCGPPSAAGPPGSLVHPVNRSPGRTGAGREAADKGRQRSCSVLGEAPAASPQLDEDGWEQGRGCGLPPAPRHAGGEAAAGAKAELGGTQAARRKPQLWRLHVWSRTRTKTCRTKKQQQ